MVRRTSALRIALAILAACLFAPIASATVSTLIAIVEASLQPGPGSISPIDALSTLGLVWVASVLIGTPLTLALFAFPLSPFWFLHHQAKGGPISFLAGGALTGFLFGAVLMAIAAEAMAPDTVLILLLFTLTGLATSALVWRIAYGRQAGGNGRRLSTIPAPAVA
jgi:hypothetical protein